MKATLWRQDARSRFPVRSSEQHHDHRSRLFLRVEHGGVGLRRGRAAADELNGDGRSPTSSTRCGLRTAATAADPRTRRRPAVVDPGGALRGSRAASNPAVALLEMAILDRRTARRAQRRRALARTLRHAPAGDGLAHRRRRVEARSRRGARAREDLAGRRSALAALVALSELTVPVLLDYNCSATRTSTCSPRSPQVREVADVVAVEQPYGVGNVVDSARLADRLDVAAQHRRGTCAACATSPRSSATRRPTCSA